MKKIKILIWIFLLIYFLLLNPLQLYVTEVDTDQSISFVDGSADIPNGIAFNPNGTKCLYLIQRIL